MLFPRSFSHRAITVSDIHQAIDFYTQALGCYLTGEPVVVREGDGSRLDALVGHMIGAGWGRLTLARLTTPEEIDVDLIETEDARAWNAEPGSSRVAIFHLHAWDPDIGGMTRRIIERGGRYCARVHAAQPGGASYTMIRCEDPFGNIIEIMAGDPDRVLSYGAY